MDEENNNLEFDSLSESAGIVRTLKWLKFLQSYKSPSAINREVDRFIEQEERRHPELKGIERY